MEIEPGRTAILRLQGPQGCLDIICLYWATGEGAKAARKSSMEKAAASASNPSQALTVMTRNFNYVVNRTDRICATTGAFTGGGDQDDEAIFQRLLATPLMLAEWDQEHFTHGNEIGRSRIDRVYTNQHVATQMDKELLAPP